MQNSVGNSSHSGATNPDSSKVSQKVNLVSDVFMSDPSLDPYSIDNMNKALRQKLLAKTSLDSSDSQELLLKANFLYVRFLPESKEEEFLLKNYDTNLVLFKHPMDYKPIAKPIVYKDPKLPDHFTPYFATVPVGYQFGSAKYEILKELYLVEPLDGDGENTTPLSKVSLGSSNKQVELVLLQKGISIQDVEAASFELTGNKKRDVEDVLAKKVGWSFFNDTWKPKGVLQFKDDYLGEQPLVGVRIIGGYSYYWREAHTDSKGAFSIPENWSFKIDYELNFDSEQFLLEDGHSAYGEDLEIEKNDTKSAWNETFTGDKAKWCVVWTGAWQYWYGNIYGLKRPRSNVWWNQSLDIWVYYKNDKDFVEDIGSIEGEYAYSAVTERIAVRAYNRSSSQIYATTVHEIAHSSNYWNMTTHEWSEPSVQEYSKLPKKLKETYARGIEWFLTKTKYGNSWSTSYSGNYTGLFQDLIDNDSRYASGLYGDNVSGFTAAQIELSVFKVTTWDGLLSSLISTYPSNTSGRVYTQSAMESLFKYWGAL